MKHDLKTELDARLSAMDWYGEDEVLSRIHEHHKTFKLRTVVIVTVILLLLCATALALTLKYSDRYHILSQARSAVSAKYDLTGDMLDLFSTDVQHIKSGWTVRFTPFALNMEAMGVYTVTCEENGTATASWSHDGAGQNSLSAKDPGINVWGAQQLERALRLRRENDAAWYDAVLKKYDDMSLEDRAALDAPLLQDKDAAAMINIAPDKTDIPPAKAQELAQKAVADKYGVAMNALAGYCFDTSFYFITKDNTRIYIIYLQPPQAGNSSYAVRLLSPSGKVTQCRWMVEPENRTLPEGDIKQYLEAAREYAGSGAFELLSARDKAITAERFSKAGLDTLLPKGTYLIPEDSDLSEAEACKQACGALEKTFGFTVDTLSYFVPHTALLLYDGLRTWQITYSPAKQEDWHWDYSGKLGTYTVTLSAKDGSVTGCAWSHKGFCDDGYTEHTFGSSDTYSARMLPWLKKLKDAQKAILIKYPEDINRDYMSVEDEAAYDELMRKAGFDEKSYSYVLPSAKDIQQDEAVTLSKQALNKEYGLDGAILNLSEKTVNCFIDYSLHDTPVKVWGVTFLRYGQKLDHYTVILNTATGEIEAIYHDSPESANG